MKKIIIYVSAISIVIIVLYFTVTFAINGTPWGKAKAMRIAQDYLDKTYSQEMIVKGIYYDIENNKYMISTYQKNNQILKFYVYVDRKDGEVWKDDYYLRYFSHELGKEANEYAKTLFGEAGRVYATLDGGIIDIYNISNLNESTKLEDVIDKFDRRYYFGLAIAGEFTNSNNEIEKFYKFINYTKSLVYKPYEIYIKYYTEKSNLTNFSFSLQEEEYQSITCANDLLQYINKELKDQ